MNFQIAFILIITILVSYYDIRYYKIPNFLSIGAWVFWGCYLLLIQRVVPMQFLISSFIALASYLMIYFVSQKKMGMGDVKLSLLLGGFGTIQDWYKVNIYATCLAFAAFIFLILAKKMSRQARIPFGPFLCVGTLIQQIIIQ